jgi:hypothetical protein
VQQAAGHSRQIRGGDFVGEVEEPAQAIQALLLFLETLGDTAVALAGQQLEALAQLLLVEALGGNGQGSREQAAGDQRRQGHAPGRQLVTEQAKPLRRYTRIRHKGLSTTSASCGWINPCAL